MFETLYVDMDGVLVDWDWGVRNILGLKGITAANYRQPPYRSEYYGAVWEHQLAGGNFWAELPPTPEFPALMALLQTTPYTILSAVGDSSYRMEEQKRNWISKYLGTEKAREAIFPYRSKSKEKYAVSPAGSRNILIDDQLGVIRSWVDAGGIGILHKTVDETVTGLEIWLSTKNKL